VGDEDNRNFLSKTQSHYRKTIINSKFEFLQNER